MYTFQYDKKPNRRYSTMAGEQTEYLSLELEVRGEKGKENSPATISSMQDFRLSQRVRRKYQSQW